MNTDSTTNFDLKSLKIIVSAIGITIAVPLIAINIISNYA